MYSEPDTSSPSSCIIWSYYKARVAYQKLVHFYSIYFLPIAFQLANYSQLALNNPYNNFQSEWKYE